MKLLWTFLLLAMLGCKKPTETHPDMAYAIGKDGTIMIASFERARTISSTTGWCSKTKCAFGKNPELPIPPELR